MSTPVSLADHAARDRIANDLDATLVVEAAAGTGKTTALVTRMVRLLASGRAELDRVVALTFTEAAAGELKLRLRGAIERARQDETLPLDERERLTDALPHLEQARIGTIHSFCADLLREHPVEAGIDPLFEMAPDDVAGELFGRAFDRWFERQLADPSDGVRRVLRWRAKSGGSARGMLRAAAWSLVERRDFAAPWRHHAFPREAEIDALVAELAELTRWADAGEPEDHFVKALRQLAAFVRDVERREQHQPRDYDGLEAGLRDLARNRKPWTWRGFRRAPAAFPKADLLLQRDALRDRLDAFVTASGANLAPLLRDALWEVVTAYEDLKERSGCLDFLDLLVRARDLVRDDAAVRHDLQRRFTHLFVDEFQDTDPLQFAIFDAIYGGSEAPLFLVGDPKQAIYSFRSADLYTYLDAARKAAARYTLVDNQRASEPLIGALNGLFGANPRAFMLDGLDYRRAGFGARQRAAFVDRSEPRAPLQVWMLPEAPLLSRRQARARAIGASAAEIARLVGAGRVGEVTIGERSLRAGDIAVLVRSHAQGSEVRAALSALGVGSVELSQQSVFASPDAEDLERLLAALLEPTRESLLKAALATGLIGLDATALEALADDDAPLQAWVQRFADYRDAWLARGAGFMLRELMLGEHVIERMLARPDGERRLTNLTHLAECLQQAAEQHTAPDALLRWLRERRQDEQGDEAAQLRLESDQDLVQIVTIHKAKGLEYGIVFCPMLWDAQAGGRGGGLDGVEYHDNAKQPVIDFRAGLDEAYIEKDVKAQRKLEAAAEDLRLIYVALTRAVHRCVIVAGCYASGSSGTPTASARSLLNWLVAGHGHTPEQWWANKKDAAAIGAAWTALAAAVGPAMALSPLPTAPGRPLAVTATPPEALAALPPPRHVPAAWWIGSYSALAFQAAPESAGADHDLRVPVGDRLRTAALDDDDFLRFPRGAAAGDCVHAVFERVDFADPAPWPERIAAVLAAQGTPAQVTGLRARMLLRLLRDVTATPLPVGTARPLTLSAVPWRRRLTELEFHLPAARLSADTLNDTVAALGLGAPRLAFGTLHGYLKGFIDAVVEHDGRYFVVDWKSNHLGDTPADYAQAALADAMAAHGYHLQSLFYAVALDRLLRLRLPDYDPARHFGGALYLFVRGLRPGWTQPDGSPAGMHFHRLPPAALRRLSALFEAPGA